MPPKPTKMKLANVVQQLENMDQIGIVWTPRNAPVVIQVLWVNGAPLVRSAVDPESPNVSVLKPAASYSVAWSITATAPIDEIGVYLKRRGGAPGLLKRRTKLTRGGTWTDGARSGDGQ